MFKLCILFAVLALAFAEPEAKADPGLLAAAYTAPVVAAAPALAYSSAYTAYGSPLAYSAGYVAAPSVYAAGYRAYPAYTSPFIY